MPRMLLVCDKMPSDDQVI